MLATRTGRQANFAFMRRPARRSRQYFGGDLVDGRGGARKISASPFDQPAMYSIDDESIRMPSARAW
ncbi:MAG: hypothetical protein AVDCRST_MAG66-4590 [uncultured Pseudonocardia sp.]|uniref:Uncharacterized protein n=1 Tax=uncultured Pseudonocardia sp. TaxID=211455 RepID=A0A6J4QIR3_9PSEU|nr:MAG: hypothetical protein AVDCRST_MAG66-4590 [uncultured Pseudonocardia sp.]